MYSGARLPVFKSLLHYLGSLSTPQTPQMVANISEPKVPLNQILLAEHRVKRRESILCLKKTKNKKAKATVRVVERITINICKILRPACDKQLTLFKYYLFLKA